MRINVYSQELTDEVELEQKQNGGEKPAPMGKGAIEVSRSTVVKLGLCALWVLFWLGVFAWTFTADFQGTIQ